MAKPKLVEELPAELKAQLTSQPTRNAGHGFRQTQILDLVRDGPLHINDLLIGIWRSDGSVVKQNALYNALRSMRLKGIVVKFGPGVYGIPE